MTAGYTKKYKGKDDAFRRNYNGSRLTGAEDSLSGSSETLSSPFYRARFLGTIPGQGYFAARLP